MVRLLRGMRFVLAVAAAATLCHATAQAQTKTVRIAKQFGISYLPLTIMEADHLLEAEGKKRGLDLKTEWLKFTGGPPMNDAILSGNLDFASGGVGPISHHLEQDAQEYRRQRRRRPQRDAALSQHHRCQRQDDQGFHRQGPHRAAGGQSLDPGRNAADGSRKGVRPRPCRQARRAHRIARPPGRNGGDA